MKKVIKGKFNVFKNVKTRRNFVIIFCITLFLVSLSSNSMNVEILNKSSIRENTKYMKEKPEKILLTSDYTLVDRINISSPSDWGLYSFINGTGSALDPYIIENIEIQGSGVKTMEDNGYTHLNDSDIGIYIKAEGNFTIRNCKISSISIGIFLDFGVSTGYTHNIEGVEINNCGIGIYSFWWNIAVNISKCDISNCNWVTVKPPYDFEPPRLYGGCGIYISGGGGSIVEFCHIRNCSIGLSASHTVSLISNQLINCGFLFDFAYIGYIYLLNNTVNGKPIGLFFNEHNLIISGQQASQYGQLIFAGCDNIQLSNVHITEPCSFGLLIHNCNNAILQNIVCENQKIGFFILKTEINADNLYAKNCVVGFFLSEISKALYYSTITRLFTNNTDIPIYAISPIGNFTIEIERSTRFYLVDFYGYDSLQLNSSVSSFILYPTFIPALDVEGFVIQINDTYTYRITDPHPEIIDIDFTIVIFQDSQPSAIPGFPLFWFYMAVLLGMLSLKVSFRWKKR